MIGTYIFSFFAGGLITTAIIYCELSGFPLLSRIAALFPVFTWLSYVFIGQLDSKEKVASHALFVLLGTLICWVPYMLTIYFFAPKVGSLAATIAGGVVFLVLVTLFVWFYKV